MPDMPDMTVPAGNTGNLIMNMLYGQQNDPAQRMADWTRTTQARNRTAAGMDLSGNLLPAPAPGTAPGVGSGQITGPPQDPTAAMATLQQTGTLSPSQTPNAYKSDETMGSLIISLQRRQEAAAGLQQALGMAGAAISRPENRDRAMRTFAPGPQGNPVELGQTLMNMSSQTQGQDRMNAIGQMVYDPQRGPALAKSLNNMSWEDLKAAFQANPASVGQMVQNFLAPTPDIQNLQSIQRMQGAGTSSPTLNDTAASIVGKIGGQQAMDMAQANWRADPKNAGKPDSAMPWKPNDPQSFAQYAANEQQKETDRGQASAVLGTADNTMRELYGHIENLQHNAGLMSILNSSQIIKKAAQEAMNDPNSNWAVTAKIAGVLDDAQIAAIDELRQVNSGQYAAALSSLRGITSRPAAVEAQGVADAMGQTKAIDLTPNRYIKQAIEPLLTKIKRSRAAAWGATGNVKNMDPDLAPYMHGNYLPGGDLYKEGSGVENFKINQPLPPDARAEAIAAMKADYTEKERAIDDLRQQGFDVRELERLTPDKLRKM